MCLIKVLAAGVNRFDHYIREGSVASELRFRADAAGEVAALGNGVIGFELGDRVILRSRMGSRASQGGSHQAAARPCAAIE